MKFADLHLHTRYSDSTYTPQELIAQAKRAGLSAISVVDHDTVDGIAPTKVIAAEENIELLPGIELTAEQEAVEIHILGYLIDYQNSAFLETLSFLKKDRVARIYKIAGRLNELGIGLNPESVFALAGEGSVGRLHIARALLKEGWVHSTAEAFHKYIGDKCPAYFAGFKFSPAEAIKLIRDVGGIPVLAHPYVLRHNEWIVEFIGCGLMGLEVYYPEHTQSMVNSYLNIARKYKLLVTGGSDCHGEAKPEIKIGSIAIPYALVEELRAAKEKKLS